MSKLIPVFIGAVLGVCYGLILTLFKGTLSVASFILYGDAYKLPFAATFITSAILIVGVVLYESWIKPAQNAIAWLAGAFGKADDELDQESWRK